MDALRIVANVSVNELVEERDALREELTEVKKALNAIKAQAAKDEAKYFELVWFSRKDLNQVLNDTSHPSYEGVKGKQLSKSIQKKCKTSTAIMATFFMDLTAACLQPRECTSVFRLHIKTTFAKTSLNSNTCTSTTETFPQFLRDWQQNVNRR